MSYVIQRISEGLFYNHLNWVELSKPRKFKRMGDLTSFLKYNDVPHYEGMKESGDGLPWVSGYRDKKYPIIDYITKDKYKIVEIKEVIV